MSLKNDILIALCDKLKTIKKGVDYNTDFYEVFRYVPSRDNASATPSICLLQESDDIVAQDSINGYNLHLLKLSLAFYIIQDAQLVDEILNDACDDVYKLLHDANIYDGSDIHSQCLRLRVTGEDKYFSFPETREAAVRKSIELLYYKARS